MEIVKDFWRCGVISASMEAVVARGTLEGLPLAWLPGTTGLRYCADPFGLWREDRLHVFVERFDYRDAVGRIDVIVLDRALAVLDVRPVLRAPWHLSYPFVFEAEGETWMLPEAHESGSLQLYRARAFPFEWEPAATIALDAVPLDATPFHHHGRWWLFYAPAVPTGSRLTTLCAAHAPALAGPWSAFAGNPVLADRHGARPGGTPIWIDGAPHLPLQRCTGGYGTAIRMLRFDRLSPEAITATITGEIEPPPAAPYHRGLHTLSAAGPVTLVDLKRRRFSPLALAAWPGRVLRRRATAGHLA